MEEFVEKKSAIFITLPEEDSTKHFLLSLFINQVYGQLLYLADNKYNRKFPNTVRLLLDEFGTLPKIKDVGTMFTASRSRNILSVPIIQTFGQLKKYGEDGEKAIRDSCKNVLFSGFSSISTDAKELSEAIGNFTTQTGSMSRSQKQNNMSYSMTSRPLMYRDEIAKLPFGKFILLRTGSNPLKIDMPLFFKWGITCGEIYSTSQTVKETSYLNVKNLEHNIELAKKGLIKENIIDNKNDEIGNKEKLESLERKFNEYENIEINKLNEDKEVIQNEFEEQLESSEEKYGEYQNIEDNKLNENRERNEKKLEKQLENSEEKYKEEIDDIDKETIEKKLEEQFNQYNNLECVEDNGVNSLNTNEVKEIAMNEEEILKELNVDEENIDEQILEQINIKKEEKGNEFNKSIFMKKANKIIFDLKESEE